MKELLSKIFGTKRKNARKKEGDKGLDIHLALSVLLLEAAHADGECSLEEMKHIFSTLSSQYDFSQEEVDKLLSQGEKKRRDTVDIYTFTRFMNRNLSHAEKLEVMEEVWRVIHIDGRLEAHEDQFAHKLANLLRLRHGELIEAKIKARKHLP